MPTSVRVQTQPGRDLTCAAPADHMSPGRVRGGLAQKLPRRECHMPFFQLSDIEPFELLPGLRIRAPFGENLMLSYLEFDRDAVVPFHSHPHEQGGIVL